MGILIRTTGLHGPQNRVTFYILPNCHEYDSHFNGPLLHSARPIVPNRHDLVSNHSPLRFIRTKRLKFRNKIIRPKVVTHPRTGCICCEFKIGILESLDSQSQSQQKCGPRDHFKLFKKKRQAFRHSAANQSPARTANHECIHINIQIHSSEKDRCSHALVRLLKYDPVTLDTASWDFSTYSLYTIACWRTGWTDSLETCT